VREDLPARQRVARRRDGGADALDHAQPVGEGPVDLGPGGQRQGDVRRRGDGVPVRADDHQRLQAIEGEGAQGAVLAQHAVRADHQEGGDGPRLQVVGQIQHRAQAARANGRRARGVGVLVGGHEDVVAPALIDARQVGLG
jgi:hypothetical protein